MTDPPLDLTVIWDGAHRDHDDDLFSKVECREQDPAWPAWKKAGNWPSVKSHAQSRRVVKPEPVS